jgi:hypothetical protein
MEEFTPLMKKLEATQITGLPTQISFSSQERGSISSISEFGIYSNTGKIDFIDHDNYFIDTIYSNSLSSTEIYLTAEHNSKKLATFQIQDFDYDDNSKKVSLRLKDTFEDWQNINVTVPFSLNNQSLYSIVTNTFSSAQVKINFSDFALSLLKRISIYITKMEEDNLWSFATKVCQISFCNISADANGDAYMSCIGESSESAIIIEPKNILKIQTQSFPHNTSVSSVSIQKKNLNGYKNSSPEQLCEKDFKIFNLIRDKTGDTTEFWTWEEMGQSNASVKKVTYETVNASGEIVDDNLSVESVENGTLYRRCSFTVTFYDLNFVLTQVKEIKISGTRGTYDGRLNEFEFTSQDLTFSENPSTTVGSYYDVSYKYDNGQIELTFTLVALKRVIYGFSRSIDIITDINISIIATGYTEEKDTYDIVYSTGKNKFQLSSNELLLGNNIIFGTYNHAETLLSSFEHTYSEGVECVLLECNLSDYYNEVGNIVYTAAEAGSFKKYDIVCPYVIRNGTRQPYRYRNGQPMNFKIIGIDYSYKGILKQTLYLQEETSRMFELFD